MDASAPARIEPFRPETPTVATWSRSASPPLRISVSPFASSGPPTCLGREVPRANIHKRGNRGNNGVVSNKQRNIEGLRLLAFLVAEVAPASRHQGPIGHPTPADGPDLSRSVALPAPIFSRDSA